MGVEFRDTAFVDNGIQQLGTAFIFNETLDTNYNYTLNLETTVPCQTYVMIEVEVSGVISNGSGGMLFISSTNNVKQAWNFYTYTYMIGNVNNTRETQPIQLQTPYCYDGVRVMCEGLINQQQLMGLVVDVYATAGNGYRYPVEIFNAYLSQQV